MTTQPECGKVVLPLTVLRRFDCVLAPVKADVLDTYGRLQGTVDSFGPVLDALTDVDDVWNTSRFDIPKLLDDPDHIADDLRADIAGFSPEAPEILDRFEFATRSPGSTRRDCWTCSARSPEIDLHPAHASNPEMATCTRS